MRRALLTHLSILALASSAYAEAPPAEEPTKQKAPDEFGTHERPWARNVMNEPAAGTGVPAPPGLAENAKRIEAAVGGKPVAPPLANVDAAGAMRAIREERAQLNAEWAKLKDARALLTATSQRTSQEMTRLAALRDETAKLIDELERREDENVDRVVKVLSTMNTKDAARLLARNETSTVVQVLDRLSEREAGEILSAMPNEKAVQFLKIIAERGRPGSS